MGVGQAVYSTVLGHAPGQFDAARRVVKQQVRVFHAQRVPLAARLRRAEEVVKIGVIVVAPDLEPPELCFRAEMEALLQGQRGAGRVGRRRIQRRELQPVGKIRAEAGRRRVLIALDDRIDRVHSQCRRGRIAPAGDVKLRKIHFGRRRQLPVAELRVLLDRRLSQVLDRIHVLQRPGVHEPRPESLGRVLIGDRSPVGKNHGAEQPGLAIRQDFRFARLKIVTPQVGNAREIRRSGQVAPVRRVRKVPGGVVFEIVERLKGRGAALETIGWNTDELLPAAHVREAAAEVPAIGRNVDVEQVRSVLE